MINARNPRDNSVGTIDLEIDHPAHGWIPFTASPDDSEPLGKEMFDRAQAGEFGPIAPYVPPPPVVPQVVSKFQAKAALFDAGLLAQVEALMANEATSMLARLAWSDAQEFRRTSPTVAAMAQALGLDAAALDALFTAAAQIEA